MCQHKIFKEVSKLKQDTILTIAVREVTDAHMHNLIFFIQNNYTVDKLVTDSNEKKKE